MNSLIGHMRNIVNVLRKHVKEKQARIRGFMRKINMPKSIYQSKYQQKLFVLNRGFGIQALVAIKEFFFILHQNQNCIIVKKIIRFNNKTI